MEDKVFDKVVKYMGLVVTAAGEGNAFKNNWNNDFRCEQIDNVFGFIKENTDEEFWKSVFNLPYVKKLMLGFKYFDENDTKLLIPIWIWNCLPDNMLIEGKMKKDLDNDTRFGCVFWKA